MTDKITIEVPADATVLINGEEYKPENKDWPQYGDTYWYANPHYGKAVMNTWEADEFDKNRLDRGLVFRTEQEAKDYDRRRIIMVKWERAADGGGASIIYSGPAKGLVITQCNTGTPLFSTKEKAQAFIDANRDDLEWYFGVGQ